MDGSVHVSSRATSMVQLNQIINTWDVLEHNLKEMNDYASWAQARGLTDLYFYSVMDNM